jgi:hypothetical protein
LLETLPFQRRRAGEQLIEKHARRVDIASCIDVEIVELRLLGRHVQGRAHHGPMRCMQGFFRESARGGVHRFSQAEVDDLRHGLVVVRRHQDVRGLQIAVDDPLLVSVLHGLADLHEEAQSLRHTRPRRVAVFGDRYALDVLHHEERPAGLGQAAVEHLGDIRMIHHGQRLALGFEPREHLARIHTRLDELERDFAPDRLRLLSNPDRPHAPFADFFEQLVAARDESADGLGRGARGSGRLTGRGMVGGFFGGRRVEQGVRLKMRGQ